MPFAHNPTNSADSRVLLFSGRNIYEDEVWRCSFREFEDLLLGIDSVDLIAPEAKRSYPRKRRLALRLGKYFKTPLDAGVPATWLEKQYSLFFAVCEKPSELLNINSVKNWEDRCSTSICLVTEFYTKDIPTAKSCLEILSRFDHVFFMFQGMQPFLDRIGPKGSYIAPGVDALRFCPYPDPSSRSIDVLSIGRRAESTHQALLQMVRDDGLFYVYDTIDDLHTYSLEEHRSLVASLAKRSRYFLVNPGKIDSPEETGGQSEFGYRYFEGAAPGTIMIGERPKNKYFDKCFDWKDVVIPLPFGSGDIGRVIREVDRDETRQDSIRETNVTQSLLRHDWVYRWEEILDKAGLQLLPQGQERKARLQARANLVRQSVHA